MSVAITVAQLRAAAPNGNLAIFNAIAATSAAVFDKWQINNVRRVWGFLSTSDEETGGFQALTENLNYSAERLCQVWPGRFPDLAAAAPYAHNPQALADKVYGGRMGDIGPNDGWLYRGEGLPQITGRDNFVLVGELTGLDTVNHPEIVISPEHMLECAVALFRHYPGILAYCDAGAFNHVWALVGTGNANGGIINLKNHQNALAAIQKAIPNV